MVKNPWQLSMQSTSSEKHKLRQIVLPILMKNMENNAHIYKTADELIEKLCKK